MAQTEVSLGASVIGSDLPLIEGARIIKEKHFESLHQVELEVDLPPAETAEFYNNAMQARGWPKGRILSIGKRSAFILKRQSGQFTLKAEAKDGRTLVTIALVQMPQANDGEKATETQPLQEQQALKGAMGNGSQARTAPEKAVGLPIHTPVADHRLAMFAPNIKKNGLLEADRPLVIHFSQPVDPAFFNFTITPEETAWAPQWSTDFRRVTLVPADTPAPGRPLNLTASVLGGPVIQRSIQFRKLPSARQLAYDLKCGRIDINQAARYRILRLFRPGGVPESYRPERAPASATPTLIEVQKNLDRLDEATRREIMPYLLSPENPDSIWHSRFFPGNGGQKTHKGFRLISTAWADARPLRDIYHTDTGYTLVIWGEPGMEDEVALAKRMVAKTKMYERFERLLGRKTIDKGDNKLKIFLVKELIDEDEDGSVQSSLGMCTASGAVPTIFISTSECETPRLMGATLAHEMFHAFQAAFNWFSPAWLMESTAVWAEDFIDKTWNTEQDYIEDAFEEEAGRIWPLDTDEEKAVYGLYLFPYYLTKINPHTDSVIRLIWENRADGDSAIASIENAVADLDDVWKAFSLATLDVEPEDGKMPDTLGEHGGFDPLFLIADHGFQKLTLDQNGIATGLVDLDGYQSAYFEIANSLQGVDAPAVSFDLAPFQKHADKVSVQAIIHYRDGRKAYEDWSDRDERLFCLNRDDQNFSRLHVVAGCSDDDLEIIEPLAIAPQPTARCCSGTLALTRSFEEREQLESTSRISAYVTETQSRHTESNRSITLRLELDLSERIAPEQSESLDLMESRVKDTDPDQVKMVRGFMENIIKTPQARIDKKTGLMKVRYRVKHCRIANAGGSKRSRSRGERTDSGGISNQWDINYGEHWSARGLSEESRQRIEQGRIRADIYYDPDSGKIQWVRVPQLDVDMMVDQHGSGYSRRRTQNGYETIPKNSNETKDAVMQLTFSSGGKAREGLPMDPVWRARQSSGMSASGKACIENPIDHEYSEPNKKGFRKGMLTESFEWSLNLSDEPADQ
ncbi:hypothetical protein [Desulfosarcina widdelii]|nr:hypothetical protein [Desulfosarcina widdelii]